MLCLLESRSGSQMRQYCLGAADLALLAGSFVKWDLELCEEGRRAGVWQSTHAILEHRFGTLPAALASALDQVASAPELEELLIFALEAPSLETFQDKLNSGLQHESLTKKQTG